MAAKQNKPAKVDDNNGAGVGRKPQIAKEPEQSFDERTGVGTPPWLREDGTQDTGEVVEATTEEA